MLALSLAYFEQRDGRVVQEPAEPLSLAYFELVLGQADEVAGALSLAYFEPVARVNIMLSMVMRAS